MKIPWLRSALISIALTACASKPAPPPTPPVAAVEPTPTPDPQPAEPPKPEPEPVPPTVVEPPPPPPPPTPEIAKECRGAKLDIAKLAKTKACRMKSADKLPIPATVTVALVPEAVALKAGGKLDAAIVLTNTSDAEVVLVLEDCQDKIAEVTYEMLDDKGGRIDVGKEGCGYGSSCSQSPLGLAIAPKGTARLPFALEAKMEIIDPKCSHKRGKPVAKGTYDLKVSSKLGPALTTKITVR